MKRIRDEHELDDELTRPSEADVEAVARLGGDLLILGVGGKMGPTLALRARRAIEKAGVKHRIIAVARFSGKGVAEQLQAAGIETIASDLLDAGALDRLPDGPNVLFMAAMKFGTTNAEHMTWAMNTC